MIRITSTLLAGLLAASPAMAQQAGGRLSIRQSPVSRESNAGQVRFLQNVLNRQGFSAGQVDGRWGPITAAALKRFQANKGLPASGHMDQATLAMLAVPGGSALAAGTSASTAPATIPPASAVPGATTPAITSHSSTGVDTTVSPASPVPGRPDPSSAAGGNDNQAVVTTNANALQPAHGANSFSMNEARRRIERNGFQTVSDLRKDGNGVWRGTAAKTGRQVQVWLDYKGNVGQQ